MYNDIFGRMTSMSRVGVIDLYVIKGSKARVVDPNKDFHT